MEFRIKKWSTIRAEAEFIFPSLWGALVERIAVAIGKGRKEANRQQQPKHHSSSSAGRVKQRRKDEFLHLLSGTFGFRSINQLEWIPLLEQFIRVRFKLDTGFGELATTPVAARGTTDGTSCNGQLSASTENSIAYSGTHPAAGNSKAMPNRSTTAAAADSSATTRPANQQPPSIAHSNSVQVPAKSDPQQ